MVKNKVWFFLVGWMLCAVCSAQDIEYPTLNSNWSYCFEYTWFGPEYNKLQAYNGTCDDYQDERRSGTSIPCIAPIVISDDGTVPDVDYLWANHRASVLCKRSKSQACATYTYWYNGNVINQTHMCARVKTKKKGIPSACYTEDKDGFQIELCVCQSGYGLNRMPCNSEAVINSITIGAIFVAILAKWLC